MMKQSHHDTSSETQNFLLHNKSIVDIDIYIEHQYIQHHDNKKYLLMITNKILNLFIIKKPLHILINRYNLYRCL